MTESGSPGRILFDATAIPANRGGVGRYVESIVPELVKRGLDVVVVCQPRDRAVFEAAGVSGVVEAPGWAGRASGRLVWEQLGLPRVARAHAAAVIHSPHYTFPLVTGRRRVVTIHDLTFFTDPAAHGGLKRRFFSAWIRLARTLRLTVVTPSHATADEYVRHTGAAASTVVAAQLGYDTEVFRPPTPAEIEVFRTSLSDPPETWIAFLGTLEPRKNVPALVEAYRGAVAHLAPAGRPSLLLAGGPGWDTAVAPAVASAVDAGFDVRLLGYLPLDQLRSLLGGSLVTAYPSTGEGFGLPVLEAMACGACVLTTERLSLPEVGGSAVRYSGVDAERIRSALDDLLGDPDARDALSAAALQRAAGFSWARCAADHDRAYRRATRHPDRRTERPAPRTENTP